jgi:hypothetical protein
LNSDDLKRRTKEFAHRCCTIGSGFAEYAAWEPLSGPINREADELTAIFIASRKTARNKDKID